MSEQQRVYEENTLSFNKERAQRDLELVRLAVDGNREALNELVQCYMPWIYNISIRMIGSPHEAEDLCQEIILKVLTRLSSFQGKSQFSTWLYRIATNHILTMKRRGMEHIFLSFEHHDHIREAATDSTFSDDLMEEEESIALIEETRSRCLFGMLLCLNREQRLAFILGGVFGADSHIGADIMEISTTNFRKKLSRARQDINGFMTNKCGLMNPENSCRCTRKANAAIAAGYVDPKARVFSSEHLAKVQEVVARCTQSIDMAISMRCEKMFREHPYAETVDYNLLMEKIMTQEAFKELTLFSL